MTPDSSRAVGCTCAPAARPLAANSEEGRNAAGNSARATVMKARYGSSVISTASAAGAVASNCGASKQTPARVVASSPRYFRFSKKLRSPGAGGVEGRDVADAPVERGIGARLGARQAGDVPNRQFAACWKEVRHGSSLPSRACEGG